jgi:hypothetical protein
MPLAGLMPQALLAHQQLAARGPANAAGQQLRAGGVAAAAAHAAQAAQAAADARKLANKKRKAMDKPASEQVNQILSQLYHVGDGILHCVAELCILSRVVLAAAVCLQQWSAHHTSTQTALQPAFCFL